MHFGVHSYKRAHDLAVLTLKLHKAVSTVRHVAAVSASDSNGQTAFATAGVYEASNELSAKVSNKLQGAMRNAASSSNPPSTPKSSGDPAATGKIVHTSTLYETE